MKHTLLRQRMHYWQRSTITRWWSADILCCLVLFAAIFLMIASFLAPEKHRRGFFTPDNPYQNVNVDAENDIITQTDSSSSGAPLRTARVSLSEQSKRYRSIFSLQVSGRWTDADALIAQLDRSDILHGHILAQRYLHADYTSSTAELTRWMNRYHDHPQAGRIHRLAVAKGAVKLHRPTAKKKLTGSGHSQPAARKKSPRWNAGIASWKQKQYKAAYQHFASFIQHASKQTTHWDRAAGHFWAYRSALKLGSNKTAQQHLFAAATHSGSFYGAQANQLLNKKLVSRKPYLTLLDRNAVKGFAPAQRASALVLAGQPELAAKEVRHGYYQATQAQKHGLLALSEQLSLPAVQIRLANQLHYRRNHRSLNPALYPTPGWEPHTGYAVDPALLFAVIRQESGFDNTARSYAGAQGVMQIMPRTADYIIKRIDPSLQKLSAPLNSIQSRESLIGLSLGQSYMRYLLERPYVDNNLVYMAIAYNAGAANLLKWQKSLPTHDPLLFIESIPFKETRHYVQNILTNFWIYQEIMGATPQQQNQLARDQWPIYTHSEQQLADAVAYLSE